MKHMWTTKIIVLQRLENIFQNVFNSVLKGVLNVGTRERVKKPQYDLWYCGNCTCFSLKLFTTLKNKGLEKTGGNGENSGNQHFLLFPQCFLLSQREKSSL